MWSRLMAIHILAVLVMLPVTGMAKGTQVSVTRGKVLAQTESGELMVNAGHKAILSDTEEPQLGINDPMVTDLLQLYDFALGEKENTALNIEAVTAMVISIDSQESSRVAALLEIIIDIAGMLSDDRTVFHLHSASIMENPAVFDLNGNALKYDMQPIDEENANYNIYFKEPLPEGEPVRLVIVSDFDIEKVGVLWQEGNLHAFRFGGGLKNTLSYAKLILPKSAILVESGKDVILTECEDTRPAVTMRLFSGAQGDGFFLVKFLWPDRDSTGLADISWNFAGEEVISLYQDFIDEQINAPELWGELGLKLVGGRFWDPAFDAFSKCLNSDPSPKWKAISTVWLGHIYDIRGDRRSALKQYEGALTSWPKESFRHDQWGIELNAQWIADRISTPFDETMLQVSEEDVKLKERLRIAPWDNGGVEVLDIYRKALELETNDDVAWWHLGVKLVGAGYYEDAFDCFVRSEELNSSKQNVYCFSAIVWQGHIYDLLGQRNKAIERYRTALEVTKSGNARHDQWNMVLDDDWVKQRLEAPFIFEMIGK